MSQESLGNTDASQEFGNNPSPLYSTNSPNLEGEGNLSPYKADYGLDIFDFPTYGPGVVFPHYPQVMEKAPLNRQESIVSPLINITYPRDTYKKWLVNLDTAQLYTANNYDDVDRQNWKFGKNYGTAAKSSVCFASYNTSDGVYASPVPILGGPLEYRKLFFQASQVNQYGRVTGECEGYYAYFPCTKPIRQTCISDGSPAQTNLDDAPSGSKYNSRNENFGMLEGDLMQWSDIDIGCGGSEGSGCSTSFGSISGNSTGLITMGDDVEQTGRYVPTGCDGALIFTGCAGINIEISGAGGPYKPYHHGDTQITGVFVNIQASIVTGLSGNSGSEIAVTGCGYSLVTSGCGPITTYATGNDTHPYIQAISAPILTGLSGTSGSHIAVTGCGYNLVTSGCGPITTYATTGSGNTYIQAISAPILTGLSGTSGSEIAVTGCGYSLLMSGCGPITTSATTGSNNTYIQAISAPLITGFYADDGYGSYEFSGCGEDFIFSGCDGVTTQIIGNTLKICGIGTSSSSCSGFSGFYDETGGSYQATRCDDVFTFLGGGGITTQINGAAVLLSTSGLCSSSYSTINGDIGTTGASGCSESFNILGGSGISTHISAANTLTITNDVSGNFFTGFLTDLGDHYLSSNSILPVYGSGDITTRANGSSLVIGYTGTANSFLISGLNCSAATLANKVGNVVVNFNEDDFYLQDDGTNSSPTTIYSNGTTVRHGTTGNEHTESGINELEFVDFTGTVDSASACGYRNSIRLRYTGTALTGFYSTFYDIKQGSYPCSKHDLSHMSTEFSFRPTGSFDIGYHWGAGLVGSGSTGLDGDPHRARIYISTSAFSRILDQSSNIARGDPNYGNGRVPNQITFSGASGIATQLDLNLTGCTTGAVLYISYTGSGGGETNCSGFSGFYDGAGGSYQATGCDDVFTFSGVSGLATEIVGNSLSIGYTGAVGGSETGFAASGCLNINKDASTKTITYGFSSGDLLSCLGYQERTLSLIHCSGSTTGCCDITLLVKNNSCDPTTTTTTTTPTTTTTTTTTTTPTTTTTTTTTTAAPGCSDDYMCVVGAGFGGDGTYTKNGTYNGKDNYDLGGAGNYAIRWRVSDSKWEVIDPGGVGIVAVSDPTTDACPSDASWSITVAPGSC